MNQYEEYDADDFLNDESFREWVLGSRKPEDALWTNWLAAHPEKRSIVDRARNILLALEPLPAATALSDAELTEMAKKIQHKIAANKPLTSPFRFIRSTWFRAAAALVIVCGALFLFNGSNSERDKLFALAENATVPAAGASVTVQGRTAKHREPKAKSGSKTFRRNGFTTLLVGAAQRTGVTLPDGTRVWLNSGSRLIYPVRFSGKTREVYLEGDGYFDVTHHPAQPFYVHAKNMNISVLGTEFYMSTDATGKANYAVLVRGSIAFSAGKWLNKISEKLVSGQQINYNPETSRFAISEVPTAEFESWKEGFVNLRSESLAGIIKRIEKYYNLAVDTNGLDLSQETFSGRLDFQQNADDVIRFLCEGTPYRYNEEERRLERR